MVKPLANFPMRPFPLFLHSELSHHVEASKMRLHKVIARWIGVGHSLRAPLHHHSVKHQPLSVAVKLCVAECSAECFHLRPKLLPRSSVLPHHVEPSVNVLKR